MMTFRQFHEARLNESIMRKGTVAAYALQGKRHGDAAEKHYRDAKFATLTNNSPKDADPNIEALKKAIQALANGLISTRQQIGSVSAQLTASSVIK